MLLLGSSSVLQAQTICNGKTVTTNNFSVSIVAARSAATVLGSVTNTANVIDADLTNFGTITSAVGLGSGGSISSQVTSTTFPAGSGAGYALQNTTILGATLLSNITITTYLNGTQQDISSAAATPLVERPDLAVSGQRVLGIITTKPFNEIRVTFSATVSSTLRVYDPLVLYPTLLLTAMATDASNSAVNDGVVSTSITGGRAPYSYTYTGPNTSIVTSNSAVTGRAPGSYTVTVSDANGCTDSEVVTVGFPTQFTCTPNVAYLVSSVGTSSTARTINLATGTTSVISTSIAGNRVVNPLGYNPLDNYLWGAFRATANSIVRFDANFNPTYYTVTVPLGVNSGDINSNGVFHLYNGNSSATTMQRVDLSSGTPTALPSLTLSVGIPIADFAFSPVDNYLYALSSARRLYRIIVPASTTATNTTVVDLGAVTLTPTPAGTTFLFGATYVDATGNLYALDNNSGVTYRINTVHTLAANQNPTATSVSSNTALIATDTDGARCPTAQVAAEARFAFNCGTATVAGSFTANGPSNQTGTLVIPITGATAGIASFTVLTAGFAANPSLYTTTLTAGQTSVSVPILYNGSGSPGVRTLSFDSEQATNAACSLTITIAGQPDLTTSIGQPTAALFANQANSLPVTINNIGNVATTGLISSTLTLPASVTAPAAFTSNGFSCTTQGSIVACTNSATIASGASTTLTIPFTPAVATIGNTLSFTNTVAAANERLTTNNTATMTTAGPVTGQPDLITSISQPAPNLVVNQTSSLPISVSNIGTVATIGTITQTLTIPASVNAPAAFTSNGFSCTTVLTTVTCTSSATLAVGSSITFAVPITPTAVAVGVAPVFSTTVATTDDESNENNNTATLTVTTAIVGQPDLTLSLAQPAPGLVAGRAGTLPVTISNGGSAATSGPVTTTLTVPTGVTAPAAFTSNGFSCSTVATRISCTSSAVITNGSSTTLAIPITPLAAAIGTAVFTATVLTGNESTTANNTASLTTTVSASVTAAPDAGTASAGTGGTAVANVVTNDVVNGVPAQLGAGGNATVATIGTYPTGITLNTATGSVSVAQGTTPGSYTIGYQLCDLLASPTCATTTITVTVLPSIVPTPDNGTVCTGVAIDNVTANDLVNGQTVILGTNATVAAVGTYPAGITLNTTTGSVSVTAGIAAAGSYTLVYQLCSTLGTPACATSTATVTVNPSVTATLTSATFCTSDNAILVATGGSSYAFSNGIRNTSGSLVLSPGVGGTYSVTVTSAQGCSAVATGTVTSQTCSPAGCTNALINPGLESPVVSATNGVGGVYYGNSVTGWYAPFASGIGLVRVNGAGFANGPNNAEDGNQYVYINATGDFLAQNFTLSCASSLNFSGYFANNSTNGSYAPWTAQITILDAGGNIVASSATKNFTSAIGDETWYPLTGSSVVLPAGNYRFYVKVTSSGYFDTANLCITPCPACVTPILSTTAITNVCSATTGDLSTITASNAPVSTSLTFHSATPATIANTVSNSVTSGTYYAAFYSASSNCYGPTVPVSVTVVPTPVAPTVSVIQPTCASATGTLTVTAPTGSGLTYSINGTTYTASATFAGVSAGTYPVTVKNAIGCVSPVTSVTLNPQPATPVATLSSATICNGTSATLTATGGSSYLFSTGLSTTAATGVLVVSPNTTTPYSVTVTSAQGCTAVATGNVTVNPSVTATLSSATICNGTSATLTATGGSSYLLNPGSLTTTSGVFVVSPTTNGSNSYSVTVTSAQGCSAIATGTVTVNPSVTATLTSATICNGTSATLTATGGSSYLLSPGSLTSTSGVFVVSPTVNGSNPYSVTVTSVQGCSAVAAGTVTVNPSVTATLSVATICNGTSTTLTATGGSSYRFSEGTVNATGILVVAPNSNGNNPYSVTVTSAQGCTAVATGNVTVNPSVTATLSSATICNGTSATLTATGGVSYRFGPGNSNTTGLLVVAPTAVGSNPYSVTVTSAQGCSAVAFGNVTVNALPQPTIAGTMSVCAGQPISLTASPTTGLTYAWTGPGGNLGSSNPLTLINSTSANSGTYQVRVTDINGCTAVASRNVTVKPVPQAQILNTSIVCANNAPAVAIATQVTGGSPPVSYAWYRSGAMGVISTDPNPVFSVADTYSLIVTDASGCLSNTATVAVMTPNPLAVNVQTANARCFGAQGTITVTTNGGTAPYTVSYYNGSGLLSSTMTSGASTLPATAGSYTIVVMDTNGCSLTQTAAITQPPLLTATLTGSGSVCAGQNTGSITSSVAGGTAPYSYAWSNGAITPNLTGLSGGTYTVVVTDANGCTTAQTITLPTNPLPATPTVSVTQPTCITLTGTIRVLTPTTGVQYTFNNGINYQATSTMAGLAPDVYQVRVRDNSTGCVSLPASVTINPVPNPPVVSITGNTTYCAGQPISLTASPASGVTYAWNGPSGNLGGTNPLVIANATPGQTGLYQVTVTDANGCTAVATTSVLVYALPIATLTANSTTMCYGQPISLTAGGGTGYAFSPNVKGVTGNTASFTAASGTAQYSVTVTSAQGCLSAPAVVTITVSSCVIPLPDSGTASAGTSGVAVASVLANDLINTLPGTVGANGNATIATIGTYPAGITLNPATGSVSVAVGTAPGNYTIAYQLCDKLTPVTCTTTTVTVLVSPSLNPAPDSGTAASGTGGVAIANLTANDRVNGLLASLGSGGNATIAPLGTFPNGITLDPQTGTVSVAPGTAPNTYTLTYQLCDRLSPITCATTTLTVLVTPAPPVLTDDINTLNINATALGNVLTNDYDPQGLPLSVTLVSPPALGTLRLSPTGSYTYTPPTDFTGLVSFTYQACNPAALCQTATATLTVLANPTVGNNPPLARNDATRTRQGQALRIVVLANDSDPDAPALAKGQLTAPVLVSGPAVGTAVVNPDGSITYTPPAVFTGGVSFTYQVCDGGSPALCSVAQVTVSVLAPALGGTLLAPVGIDDGFLTRLNTALVGDVSANDLDANSPVQPLSYSSGQPQSGTVVMSGVGSYTYTPAGGYSGPVSFTYAVCNPAGLCGVATVYGVVQVTDKVTLLGRVYLQGALLGVYRPSVLMRDDLRARGLLPLSSPYGSLGALTPVGSLSSSVTGVTGVDAVVDWVYVELRSAANPALVVDSRSALLQRDGDIVDVDGVSGVRFDVAEAGSYYVAVRHRNHLGAMSGLSVPLSVSGVVVDLRTGATPMYSYSSSALNQALVGVDQGFALWAGNALSDAAPTAPHEVINFQGTNNDITVIYQRVIGAGNNTFVTPFFKLKGYYNTDLDLSGETIFQGSGNDPELIYQNITKNHPGNQFLLPNFTIREQLP